MAYICVCVLCLSVSVSVSAASWLRNKQEQSLVNRFQCRTLQDAAAHFFNDIVTCA